MFTAGPILKSQSKLLSRTKHLPSVTTGLVNYVLERNMTGIPHFVKYIGPEMTLSDEVQIRKMVVRLRVTEGAFQTQYGPPMAPKLFILNALEINR